MPVIDSVHLYSQVDKYWELVRRTLGEIFHADSAAADTLRKTLTTWPAQEQLLFYHVEPLYIAADLVNERPTETQIKDYTRLAASNGWYANWLPPQPPSP